ncbi:MAG TPA: SPFH domain-containing protein, partial [Tepidisphaeraceae bacterium]|nr:SPFH domain-containing protein [Tepidisphaeraceae bacterium]
MPGPPVEGRAKRFFRVPKTVGHLLAYFGAVWGAIGLLAIVLSVFSLYAALVALAIFIVATVALGQQSWLLLRARQRVLVEKDVPLLWGMVRLIAWDPVEGVLVLRNKSVAFSDDDLHDGQGGVRFLYPVMGEELALRIPLEVQTLRFADENVLTQEYLSLTIRGTMKWRLVDVRKFYLLVSRELRSTTDAGGAVQTSASHRPTASGDAAGASDGTTRQLLNAAIEWLRVIAEEHSRKVVSRVKSGLLLADRVSAAIPEMKAAAVAPNATG